ncbi:MAG: GNAT family N-acetyltransferase [Lysobacteraceae bacterium]|nr:MAG: GNAT family N-acetyltransferase [Xanthomonadaceae bacterium]
MYRLRCHVFHDRLGWDVRVENGREHDWFDLIGPHYLVAHNGDETAIGCCRLLPTQGPNMLRDIFPFLLDGSEPPAAESVWEVSRFAVSDCKPCDGFGFSEIPSLMVAQAVRFAADHGVEALVGVTSAPFERMLQGMGLQIERLGAARRIGRVMSLAFRLPLDAATLKVANDTVRNELRHAA